MGDLTNAVMQGLQLREQRRMNDFAIDSARQQLAMREQEYAQQQDLKKMTMTQAVLQDFVSRRDRLSNQLPDITAKAMEATNALNAARMNADAIATRTGGRLPPGVQANIESLARNHEFLTSAAAKTQEDAFRIDEAISRLTMESGALGAVYGGSQAARDQPAFPKSKGAQAPAGTGGEQAQAQPAGMEAPAMAGAEQPAGEGGYQTFDPATTTPDDWQKILAGGPAPMRNGVVRDGIVQYEFDTKDEADAAKQRLSNLSKAMGAEIPAVIIDRSKLLDDAERNMRSLSDDIDRSTMAINSISNAMKLAITDNDALIGIMNTMDRDSPEAVAMTAALSAKGELRKELLSDSVEAIKKSLDEKRKHYKVVRELALSKYPEGKKLLGVEKRQNEIADAFSDQKAAKTGAKASMPPPGIEDNKMLLAWYRQNVGDMNPQDPASVNAFLDFVKKYRGEK